jgi:hypothetical protein
MADSLCYLVDRVPAADPEVSGSILGVTKFPEELWVWNGVHSAS